MFEFRVPSEKLYKGLPAGVRLDVFFPGFPTMKHLPHKVKLCHDTSVKPNNSGFTCTRLDKENVCHHINVKATDFYGGHYFTHSIPLYFHTCHVLIFSLTRIFYLYD